MWEIGVEGEKSLIVRGPQKRGIWVNTFGNWDENEVGRRERRQGL